MTTTQVQSRRDTAANLALATPAEGEQGYDKTNKRPIIGDGSTAGGIKVATAKDLQNAVFTNGTTGGTGNAITLTHSQSPVAGYSTPLILSFKASASNTGPTTVNIDGLGAKNIYKISSGSLVALASGDIVSGGIYYIAYDGTQFQLIGSSGGRIASVKRQEFTSSATYTPSTGMLSVLVKAVAGGGGGGRGWGSGGGGGETVMSLLTASDIGVSKTVTIAAKGNGAVSPSSASAGGDTSLGSLVIAKGGLAGTNGTGTGSPTATFAGGGGGTGGTGQKKIPGQPGFCVISGVGASGRGGSSNEGYGGQEIVVAATAGNVGTGKGSGGGGSSGATASGGDGTAGYMEMIEFCSV